jgi:hypothetical protein
MKKVMSIKSLILLISLFSIQSFGFDWLAEEGKSTEAGSWNVRLGGVMTSLNTDEKPMAFPWEGQVRFALTGPVEWRAYWGERASMGASILWHEQDSWLPRSDISFTGLMGTSTGNWLLLNDSLDNNYLGELAVPVQWDFEGLNLGMGVRVSANQSSKFEPFSWIKLRPYDQTIPGPWVFGYKGGLRNDLWISHLSLGFEGRSWGIDITWVSPDRHFWQESESGFYMTAEGTDGTALGAPGIALVMHWTGNLPGAKNEFKPLNYRVKALEDELAMLKKAGSLSGMTGQDPLAMDSNDTSADIAQANAINDFANMSKKVVIWEDSLDFYMDELNRLSNLLPPPMDEVSALQERLNKVPEKNNKLVEMINSESQSTDRKLNALKLIVLSDYPEKNELIRSLLATTDAKIRKDALLALARLDPSSAYMASGFMKNDPNSEVASLAKSLETALAPKKPVKAPEKEDATVETPKEQKLIETKDIPEAPISKKGDWK